MTSDGPPGIGLARFTLATVIDQIGHQPVHLREPGTIEQLSPIPLYRDQPGLGEFLEMKGQIRAGQAKHGHQRGRSQAVGTCADQRAEDP
jgi:hypothetical protein